MSARRVTTGIDICDEIFVRTLPSGEEFFTEDSKGFVESGEMHFPKLFFLVRDWKNIHDYRYGVDGGKKYLNGKIEIAPSEEKERISENLRCYSETSCYLMPYPGKKVDRDPEFNGSQLSDMEDAFKKHLKDLIEKLFSPENLILKEIARKRVSLQEYLNIFKKYVKICNNQDSIIQNQSLFEVYTEARYKNISDEEFQMFADEMDKLMIFTIMILS
ncbi:unnamed protein product [Darwinula stevensoni]|uniref:GB1/RHD3-type G domain-containing protein n=1 Tax=Darwinula stevensoni TaxID=69355 RepID=A0A7R8XHT1_9CRUS|nr:unnamed protein product [Darwinula stevensoni]CAG0893143.1 unnamed protein product [Darwinula stevensoni]